jgi:hypothetical protein
VIRLRDENKAIANRAPSKQLFLRRWTIVIVLGLMAGLAVLYISNTIVVDKAIKKINDLEKERNSIHAKNEQYRADVLRLTALDYIGPVAQKKLGMRFPKKAAIDLTEPTY